MNKNWRVVAAVVGAEVVLLLAGVLVVVATKDAPTAGGPRPIIPKTTPVGLKPGGSGSAVRRPVVTTFEGRARSVLTAGQVEGLATIQLGGDVSVSGYGTVVDSARKDHGKGSLRVSGAKVRLDGASLRLMAEPFLVRATAVSLGTDRFPRRQASVEFGGDLVLTGGRVEFTAQQPLPTGSTPSTLQRPTTTAPEVLTGPVTLRDRNRVQIGGSQVQWVELPRSFTVAGASRFPRFEDPGLSWAGSGSVRYPGLAPLTGEFLGAVGSDLEVAFTLGAGEVALKGSIVATQVYEDGVPKLATTAIVELTALPPTVAPGGRGWLPGPPATPVIGRWPSCGCAPTTPPAGGSTWPWLP